MQTFEEIQNKGDLQLMFGITTRNRYSQCFQAILGLTP